MATISKHRGKWQARIRRQGYRDQCRTFETQAQARAWARSVERDMDRNEWQDTTEAQRTTLTDALDRYAREITPHKKGSKQEALRLQAWQRVSFADRPLARVRGTDVAEWRDERLAAGISGQTIRNDLSVLSHVFKIARTEWGMAGLRNPCDDVRRPKGSRPRTRRLETGEEAALLKVADPVWKALIVLAIETGMRRGELLGLTWDRIDQRGGVVHLPDTKNSTGRDVPLSPAALKALKALPRQIDGSVFPLSLNDHGNRWRTLAKSAGITGLTFHDLRHEATSRFVESGRWNMAEIAAITGHKTMEMLKRYYTPDVKAMARRMRQRKSPGGDRGR